MERLRSLDEIHLTEEQYLCFSKMTQCTKYVGKSFVNFAYPSWQQLIENSDAHPYFIWPTINGWLGALNLGLKELKCPGAAQLYSDIRQAYEHCQSVHEAQQTCRLQRRHDNIRVMCFVYFISLGEGLFQVSLNPPAGKKSSELNLSHVWQRWSSSVKEMNTVPTKRDSIFQSKVRKLAVEAEQVNRVGQAWSSQLPTMDHLIQSIPCDSEGMEFNRAIFTFRSVLVQYTSISFVLVVISDINCF